MEPGRGDLPRRCVYTQGDHMHTYKDALVAVTAMPEDVKRAFANEMSITDREPDDRKVAQRLCEVFQLARMLRQIARW